MDRPPRARIYLVAAICLGAYLAVQTFQFVLGRVLPGPQGAGEQMLARLGPWETARAIALLLSHFALVPVYVAVAARRWPRAPGAAVCGAVFGGFFVLFEVAYRTIDLFLVSRGWAVAYAATADAGARAALLERTALWEQAVGAWYFGLLASHLLASICFLIATARREPGAWDRLAQAAFALNALRLTGRILGSWPGIAWLRPLSSTLYFPFIAAVLALLTIWLARQARAETRASGCRSPGPDRTRR